MLTVLPRPPWRLVAIAVAATVAWLSASSPAHAIIGGERAPNTAAARSTVFVESRQGPCTGTLVAPDLVLTAGHCIAKPELDPPLHPRFRPEPEADWQRPDRFYDLPGGATVTVGVDREGWVSTFRAPEYAIPGRADMLLLRLEEPVPAALAPPVPILTRPPGRGTDVAAWARGLTFQIAGFGDTADADRDGDGDIDRVPSRYLNHGVAHEGEFPCASNDAHKLCVQSADGSKVRTFDSGGPLYWTDESGVRWLVGVTQGWQNDSDGRYMATFYRGGGNTDRTSLPNVGGWLDQFVRGRQGGLAFLRTTDPESHEMASEIYSSNPSGLAAHVKRLGVGDYEARFEGLRHTERREPRVAIVTALGSAAAYCKLADASAADRVHVRCYDRGGFRVDSRFALATDISDSDLLVRVPHLASGSTSVPSAHGAVSVTRLERGSYRLLAPGFRGDGLANVLASAEGPGEARCHTEASSSTSPSAVIRCMTAGGLPIDSGFTVAATSGSDSGYALAHQVSRSSYLATPRRANVPGTDAQPTIERLATGRYEVTFTGAPVNLGGNVHAAAYGATSNHCAVAGWTATTASVLCRNTAGVLADTMFVVRYLDPLDVGRRVDVALRELHATSVDECGELDMYGSLSELGGSSVDVPLVSNADTRVLAPPVALITTSRPGARLVQATLRLRDQDGSCGGSSRDDEVDIAADAGATELRLQIDVQAHTVRVLDAFPQTLGGLGVWWSDGRDGLETARVELDADITSPVGL